MIGMKNNLNAESAERAEAGLLMREESLIEPRASAARCMIPALESRGKLGK